MVGDDRAPAKPSAAPPVVPARLRYEATLERIVEWTAATRSLFLRLRDGKRLAFTPGQFISLALPVGGGEPIVRAYSLASSPEAGELLEICIDRVPGGPGSGYLFTLGVGARVQFTGPFGSFVLAEPVAAEMVFIAEATAIAPIRPMVRRILARGGGHPVTILHAARRPSELLYRDEFEAWERAHPRLRWEAVLAATPGGAGDHPSLEELVRERYVRADAARDRHFWICGVGGIVRRLRDLLRGAGYARRAVRYERW